MSSAALGVFERLLDQVVHVRAAAARDMAAGFASASPVLHRSCIILTVAAFDTYFHEQGTRLLLVQSQKGAPEATTVANYLGGLTSAEVTGPSAEGYVRLRLSYKTLVAPDRLDTLFTAIGQDANDLWLRTAFGLGSRPDRLRMLTQLQFDRRNQIAHEGDWDFVALDFRAVESAHVDDCVNHMGGLVRTFDSLLP